MDLEFCDLSYTITSRGLKGDQKPLEILKSVSGKFHSGQLSAIMGPSGAGKSSLLNVLSGYMNRGVSGQLMAGGCSRDERHFRQRCCYLTQEDLLQPLMTAGELMSLAAALKLPGRSAPRRATVQRIFANLGLTEHEHTRTENLSGGQKKRLSIALELVNNPPVFFLDEPTSGLDQVTTGHCVRLLRSLAQQGRTVVCTIHQPSASIFEHFDQVYVLAQGKCVYQGETTALIPFLSSVGLPCPRHHNPADFVIELTENPYTTDRLSEIVQNGKTFQLSNTTKAVKSPEATQEKAPPEKSVNSLDNIQFQRRDSTSSATSQESNRSSTMAWMKMRKFSTQTDIGYPSSSFIQFKVLLMRMFLQIRRNKTGMWIQTLHHILCGLLIGLCFYGTANDGTEMFNHLKFCVGITIFFAYTQIMVPVLIYPQEVKLLKKEHFNRWYGLTPYYAALTVSKLPLQISLNVVFCSIVYFMVGLPVEAFRFAIFCLIGNMVSLVAEGIGLAIGSVFNVTNGCAIGPLAIAPFLGLGIYGFDFAKSIPWIMQIFMRFSFIRCGVVAMVLTVFGYGRKALDCDDVYCHFAEPDVLLEYVDVKKSSVQFEVATLFGLMCLFRSMCYLGLRIRFSRA